MLMEAKNGIFALSTVLAAVLFIENASGQFITWHQTEVKGKFVGSIVTNSHGDVFASASGSLYKTYDNGESWILEPLSGIQAVAINKEGDLYAASRPQFHKSEDNGHTWTPFGNYLDDSIYKTVTNSKDHIFVAAWEQLGNSGRNGVLLSKDDGNSWSLELGFATPDPLFITPDDIVFAGYGGEFLYRTTNDGDTWQELEPNLFVEDLASNRQGEIYAAGYNPRRPGVYKSINNGDDWEQIFQGNDISIVYLDQQDNIYAVHQSGRVYFSSDDGSSWMRISEAVIAGSGLVTSFVINSRNYAFLGTSQGGILASIDPVTSVERQQTKVFSFKLFQNHPNPFNPSTKIAFRLANASEVEIKVYNALGGEVVTLLKEYRNAGNHEAIFDGADLPSGVYFFRIIAGHHSDTKKMLLLK